MAQTQASAPQTIRATKAVKIKRALISVTNKDGLEDLAACLHKHGIEILSTGGTAKKLSELDIPVKDVSSHTGFPEIMDGRVKTLHPKIHGGILAARDKDTHLSAMQEQGIEDIDLVIVNLYPFTEVIANGADFPEAIENIDIGGPAMIRAAAKNHDFVTVITDPQDYAVLMEELESNDGQTSYTLRRRLAATAYALTATYDSNIASWLTSQIDIEGFPRRISFSGDLKQTLRYGENPHQSAALYIDKSNRPGVTTASQLQGKELSFNNINDTDAAFELVCEFDEPTVAIIKHANPCGVASAKTVEEAYTRALACDPTSAFGGIIALNKPLNKATAEKIIERFYEVVIAPAIEPDAIQTLKNKEKIRVLTTGTMPEETQPRLLVRSIAGGLLVQDSDTHNITEDTIRVVTEREPTKQELEDMLFAFRVAKHVKSNAIVYAKNGVTTGIGAGQMSRIDSARIAIQKAQDAAKEAGLEQSLIKGSVVASDAFFPFADGLITAAEAGATAVIQPGGSIRDEEVIKAADDRGLAMVFTDIRHFKH